MTKSTAFLLCLACLAAGFVFGQNSMEEPKPAAFKTTYETLLTDMSSDGRRILSALKDDLLRTQSAAISNAFFEQTRAVRLMTQPPANKEAAARSLASFRKIVADIQKNADDALLDALESMNDNDRDVYLKHHLKNKKYLMNLLIIQPLMTDVKSPKKPLTGQPRDLVRRTVAVPDLTD